MSGDVQPRKRKDKRKKKDGGSLGMIHEPVISNKFKNENEDRKVFDSPDNFEKIHVQSEHGIGGNICVKIIFFCLFGLLIGAVGLIYMQSQNSSDVDLPKLEESRFADYFTGWLDDNTEESEHDTIKNEIHDHSHEDNEKLDNQEEMETFEENDSEEEDHSVEEDPISSLFGIQNDDESEEVQTSSAILNEVPESEELGVHKKVNEDEENGDFESNELEEKELQESKINENYDSDELEEQDNERDDGNENLKEDYNYGASVAAALLETDKEEKNQGINKDKKYGVRKGIFSENGDDDDDDDDDDEDEDDNKDEINKDNDNEDDDKDDDENDDSENSSNIIEKSNEDEEKDESDDKEEEKQSANLKEENESGYEEVDISDEDLEELQIEPNDDDMRDEFEEDTDKSFVEEIREEKTEDLESEILKEEEEVAVDAGGVAIKLGVGIALIIIAHLVLVQKWKSVSNAASDEKASFEAYTTKGKNEKENLHSPVESVISRRQTLLPENVFFNDEMDEEDMEEEDEDENDEGMEEEGFEESEKVRLEEVNRKEEVMKLKKDNWDSFNEPLWKVKSQDIESEIKAKFNANNELEVGDEEDEDEDEDEEEDENEDENGIGDENDKEDKEEEDDDENEEDDDENEEDDDENEEDGDEEEVEEENEEEIEEMEEEDDYMEDDEIEDNNDFRRQKVFDQEAEELSSQEELKESVPVPPPRAHRDGRGAKDVDEDPIKQFEEINEIDEGLKEYFKADGMAPVSQDSETDNENKPGQKMQKDEWSYIQELEIGDEQFENNPKAAVEAYDRVLLKKPTLVRALMGRARALDHWAEKEKSNKYLRQAIDAYKTLLLNNWNLLDNETYVKMAERCIDRMRFAGALVSAIEVHKALIMKYPNTPKYRNMLAVTYLMMNKIPQARVLLEETLSLWPENGFALVHYGFILKTSDDNMEEGAKKLMAGIQTKEEGVMNGMFFFHLGDALHRLGRGKEAMEWYELGVKEGLFLSKYQRSLYNVNRLKGRPWWTKKDTTYQDFFTKLENNWKEIRREGLELLHSKGVNLFKEEAENLKDTGDWKQLDLFFRGKKTPSCNKAPVTCSLVSSFHPAATCTRGQIKFSVMLPNTHVWPHCGPTNCRLRSHLGLVVPKHTFIRVAEETRSWEEGKFIIFDDSFEHEVWHNGTGPRLVLIVDVWHPELTNEERRTLSPI